MTGQGMRTLLALAFCAAGCSAAPPGGPSAPAPPPADPCAAAAATCDRQAIMGGSVTTGATTDGLVSVVRLGQETHIVEWRAQGGQTQVTYWPAEGGALGPASFDGPPGVAAEASLAAVYLAASNHEATSLTAQSFSIDGNPINNHAGCDVIRDYLPGLECNTQGPYGYKGKCCDLHDECINMNCQKKANGMDGTGGLGPVVVNLLAGGFFNTPRKFTDECIACQRDVIQCLRGSDMPGQSDCCIPPNDCGRSQQCMIEGIVVTNPCQCQYHGYRSVASCQPNQTLTLTVNNKTPNWLLISYDNGNQIACGAGQSKCSTQIVSDLSRNPYAVPALTLVAFYQPGAPSPGRVVWSNEKGQPEDCGANAYSEYCQISMGQDGTIPDLNFPLGKFGNPTSRTISVRYQPGQ